MQVRVGANTRLTYDQFSLAAVASLLDAGEVTSHGIVSACLEQIQHPRLQGNLTFNSVNSGRAEQNAVRQDELRKENRHQTSFSGIPISIKDIFDYAGETTAAGSKALFGRPRATQTATCIQRLEDAGFVILGRTNMSELACSGTGLNPQFGTPSSIWEPENSRIPGGSSSGAAISVARCMAYAGIGTDTGGSCRIPAAFNGLVGFKPTADSVSRDGVLPLSPSLDGVGVVARTVACCRELWRIMSGKHRSRSAQTFCPAFVVPDGVLLNNLDLDVSNAFSHALSIVSRIFSRTTYSETTLFDDIAESRTNGSIPAFESYDLYWRFVEDVKSPMDPGIRRRILKGSQITGAQRTHIFQTRQTCREKYEDLLGGDTFLLCPTVAIVPPLISDFDDNETAERLNDLVLRNTSQINFVDGCAVSIPIKSINKSPCGLMIAGRGGNDERLLFVAEEIEKELSR